MKIRFDFKPFKQGLVPIPSTLAKFKCQNREDTFVCLVDSGADFCTLPLIVGRLNFQIDFEKKIASAEIKNEWKYKVFPERFIYLKCSIFLHYEDCNLEKAGCTAKVCTGKR